MRRGSSLYVTAEDGLPSNVADAINDLAFRFSHACKCLLVARDALKIAGANHISDNCAVAAGYTDSPDSLSDLVTAIQAKLATRQ